MTIGERIFLARRRLGMSQDLLSRQIGVSKMAVSKYEREMDMPSSKVLIRLSEALQVPVEFFFRPPIGELQIQWFRKLSSLTKKEQESVIAQTQEWLERYLEIEEILQEAPTKVELPKYAVKSLDDVESAANDLRNYWSLGDDAIESVVELLEDQRIKVGIIDGLDGFDACTFYANDAPVIVVKRGLSGDRQRFSLAHELGHLVLECDPGIDAERIAHRFAGAFLVPAATARRELGSHRTNLDLQELGLLKQKYGMSMQAWVYRSRNLNIISDKTGTILYKRFSAKGWKKREPGHVIEPAPRRMQRLILRALAEGLISLKRAEELLGGSPDNLFADLTLQNDITAADTNY